MWQTDVQQTWARVAAERGLDFDPPPQAVAAALPSLVATVEQLAAGMDEGDRRWLAAALAAPGRPRPAQHPARPSVPTDEAEAGSGTG